MPKWREDKVPLTQMMWVRVLCRITRDGEIGVAEDNEGNFTEYGIAFSRIPMQRERYSIPMSVTLEGVGPKRGKAVAALRKGDVVIVRGYLQRKIDGKMMRDDRYGIIVSSIRTRADRLAADRRRQ